MTGGGEKDEPACEGGHILWIQMVFVGDRGRGVGGGGEKKVCRLVFCVVRYLLITSSGLVIYLEGCSVLYGTTARSPACISSSSQSLRSETKQREFEQWTPDFKIASFMEKPPHLHHWHSQSRFRTRSSYKNPRRPHCDPYSIHPRLNRPRCRHSSNPPLPIPSAVSLQTLTTKRPWFGSGSPFLPRPAS